MAIAIQTVPILKGKVADRFLSTAAVNESHHANTIDFSKQYKSLKSILENSKLKDLHIDF